MKEFEFGYARYCIDSPMKMGLAEKKRNCSFLVSLPDFGSGTVLCVPYESFSAAGIFMRKELLRGKTALAAILNNGTGYIPNPWSYSRGEYETPSLSSSFQSAPWKDCRNVQDI